MRVEDPDFNNALKKLEEKVQEDAIKHDDYPDKTLYYEVIHKLAFHPRKRDKLIHRLDTSRRQHDLIS